MNQSNVRSPRTDKHLPLASPQQLHIKYQAKIGK